MSELREYDRVFVDPSPTPEQVIRWALSEPFEQRKARRTVRYLFEAKRPAPFAVSIHDALPIRASVARGLQRFCEWLQS